MKQTARSLLLIAAFAAARGILPAAEAAADSGINRPVSTREIDQLNLQLSDASRSSVEAIGEFHTESGDLNNRLDFWRYGARLNYRQSGATTYYLRVLQTQYMTANDYLNAHGLNFTGGVKTTLSDNVTAQFEGGATRFSTSATSVNAMGTLRYQSSNGSALYVTGTRSNVEETLLSATGIRPAMGPFGGQLVGQVMDNRGVAGGRYQLTPRFDLFAEGGLGIRDGHNIESNFLKAANGGFGYNILSRSDAEPVNLVRASYSLDYFGFEKDLLGFGGASLLTQNGYRAIPLDVLGSDGMSPAATASHPGVGGYFSPHDYISNVGRLEVQGRPHPHFEYRLSGFMGTQDYTGSELRQARGFSASATIHINDRYSIPVTYVKDNFGPFTQQSVFFKLVARL